MVQWDRQPVIVGVGQECWRDRDATRTPVDALQAVLARAASDTGSARTLAAIDALVHVPFLLNQVPDLAAAMPRNPGAAVAERLGISPAQFTADVGGNLPQQLVNDFAGRLVRGDCEMVALCGVELLASFFAKLRSGEGFPDWASGRDDEAQCLGQTPVMTAPTEQRHGLYEPIHAYPLFESALAHSDGLTREAHQARLGALVSAMSTVAAANPYAWKQQQFSAEDVLSTADGNRMIAYPYTKLMNAILAVDQAAAVLLTTVGKARELGIDPSHCVYLRGCGAAHDPWFISEREALDASPAIAASTAAALDQSGLTLDAMTHFDLYSCFPSAVQVACREIGLALDDPRGVTVTGGLTLFGGPGNNYSLHGIAEMAQRLRDTRDGAGLVTANGGYLTKHAVGVYASAPGDSPWVPGDDASLQQRVDDRVYPRLVEEGVGLLTIEGHTVRYKGEDPAGAIVLGRLENGARCVAVSEEAALLDVLVSQDWVGHQVSISHKDGVNTFTR